MDYVTMISTTVFCGGLAISAFLLTAREFARMETKQTRIPRIAASATSVLRRP